jgi:uncharacterized repeat protein (TIGR03803 family)
MTILAAQSAQAQTYKVLHAFTGGADGAYPNAVTHDAMGNLYGTTQEGGAFGYGTVFKLSKTGKMTTLHEFKGGADGGSPSAGLIQGADGNLYGTTDYGGDLSCHIDAPGCGVVFEMSKTGKETVLYSFKGQADGVFPNAVTEDSNGDLYGTTQVGGNTACSFGCGIVFKLSQTGEKTVLYTFKDGAGGNTPFAGVILDAQGSLYGTTLYGGRADCGVVFKLDTTGRETVLHSFTCGADGRSPYAGVIRDVHGNLYGTTFEGGAIGLGAVFKLSKRGKETVLYSFTGGKDGGYPEAEVTQDAEGNLYTTTSYGGASGGGTVFKLSRTDKGTALYSFTLGKDGGMPLVGLIRDAEGHLYGATSAGGDLSCGLENSGCGVVFKLTP